MPIPGGDVTLLTNAASHALDVMLNAWPLRVVATATITQTSFAYPIVQLTVASTAGWSNILPGQMVRVTSGTQMITEGVVRKAPGATTLYIDPKHRGDPGRAQHFAQLLATAQIVTIYDYMPLWTLYSIIRDGVFYKQWDLPFTNQASYPEPVVNLGSWRQAWDDGTGSAILSFSASGSFDWRGVSLGYTWSLPPGATLAAGTLSSATISVRFPVGFHLLRCTVTNGTTTRTGIRPVWVNARTGDHRPISDRYTWQITSDRHTLLGRSVTFQFTGDIPATLVPDGGAFFLTESATFAGASLSSDAGFVDAYAGIAKVTVREATPHVNSLTIDTHSPADALGEVACPPQAILENAAPANWTQTAVGRATPSFVIWYLMNYHCPNALTLFDYSPLADTTRKSQWSTSGTTLGEQIKEVASVVAGNFGSASAGAFYFRRNPVIENDAFRSAMDERMTLTADHLRADQQITWPETYRPSVGEYRALAFSLATGTTQALAARAGKQAQGQGATKTQGPGMVVASQAELNTKAGNLMAMENNPTPEIEFKLARNIDVFDPARDFNHWWRLDIDDEYDARGLGYAGRVLCKAVARDWRRVEGDILKNITVTLQPETRGQDGEVDPVPANQYDTGDYPPFEYTVGDPVGYAEETYPEGVTRGTGRMAFFNADGAVYITEEFSLPAVSGGPPYTAYPLGIGTLYSFKVDDFSPKYRAGGAVSTVVNGWIAASSGLYHIYDIFGARTLTLRHTFLVADPVGGRRISASFGAPNRVICVSYHGADGTYPGTYAAYTTNDVSWSEAVVSAHYEASDAIEYHPAVHVSSRTAGTAWAIAYSATGSGAAATLAIYKTTNGGASWSEDTSAPITSTFTNLGNLHLPFGNAAQDLFYWTQANPIGTAPFEIDSTYWMSAPILTFSYTHQDTPPITPQVHTLPAFPGAVGVVFTGSGTATPVVGGFNQSGITPSSPGIAHPPLLYLAISNLATVTRDPGAYFGPSIAALNGAGYTRVTGVFAEALQAGTTLTISISPTYALGNVLAANYSVRYIVQKSLNPFDPTGSGFAMPLFRTKAGVETKIAPGSGQDYGGCMVTSATDSKFGVLVGRRRTGAPDNAVSVFTTSNADALPPVWTEILAGQAYASAPRECVIAGSALYLFGAGGSIYYSPNRGAFVERKNGNIPDDYPGAGAFVGMCGG